ncbi:type 1 glutamine amidotransferase domain-containing protein [Aquisalinus flavus]|uniref:Dimethylallyltransferase n=1 Tax=Aquisalinus flavus TaxID=1526572 RepID=A0A8J2V5I4_9PROT|nr:type 1 glutamine amidotransferase domain-containing protein [Aquisalinus flavus]MBD0427614.1 type 1 glutamine amidotransferase domain-containing protein [Aquisalinus flavus]UNE47402.1 type 1 glutamine amidotransferase domain-containing protein [Aquisalinus flavus]GGD02389.1 dimethylallyltransferase [Aquisalinus flavus]
MLSWLKYAAITLSVLVIVVWLGLPHLLTALGLHPHYDLPEIDASGKRALVITTSHDTLGDTGKATGVFASEMTAPYYAFLDSGMAVDVASIQGGEIPFEPQSLRWPIVSAPDKRFRRDPDFRAKVQNSLAISEVDISDYDIVFLAGGWGAAYDFAQSVELGAQMSAAYDNGAVIGGVCHGPLGLLQARTEVGDLLLEGRRVTAVTDKQIKELGISHTPMHPERDLRAAGVVFESDTAFRDFFASKVVVDGRLVTGQNQNDGTETAVKMMQVLLGQTDG